MQTIGKYAQRAKESVAYLDSNTKNNVLEKIAKNIIANKDLIIHENKKDLDAGRQNGLTQALLDRLTLNDSRIDSMVLGLKDIIAFEDPIGKVLEQKTLENELEITKVSVPLGVIGIIYESRPNVTLDAFALCFKAGNAVILKGGKEAIYSNTIIESLIQDALKTYNLDPLIIQVIKRTDREATQEMMRMDDAIDVLIPRGSSGLIRTVVENSTIPVIQTGSGNCHIYLDESADETMAVNIIHNAKTQRLGVCNAVESLVIHESIAPSVLPKIYESLKDITLHGDELTNKILPKIELATEEDFSKEYLSEDISIKIVSSIDAAIEHINHHNTKHSESIITNNSENAALFTQKIDASTVYINASTRFTDGSVFGLGAEIGISTQKLHARGPMGLAALTSYKYIVKGNGQTRD